MIFKKNLCVAKNCLNSFLLVAFCLTSSACHASEEKNSQIKDMDDKAKIMSRIVTMVKWPNTVASDETFRSCSMSSPASVEDDFLEDIHYPGKETEFVMVETLQEAEEKCQVLFVETQTNQKLKEMVDYFDGKQILLISNMKDFARHGGHLNFHKVNEKMGMTLNTIKFENSGFDFDLRKFNEVTIIPEKEDVSP